MGHVQSILKSIFITEWAFTHLVNNFELVKIVFFGQFSMNRPKILFVNHMILNCIIQKQKIQLLFSNCGQLIFQVNNLANRLEMSHFC